MENQICEIFILSWKVGMEDVWVIPAMKEQMIRTYNVYLSTESFVGKEPNGNE